MKSIKKTICAFDVLIFFFINCVFYSNPIFCLGPSSLFQEKETEQYSEASFLKSLNFLDNFLDNQLPKHEQAGLFKYWKELTIGKKSVFDPPLKKEMIELVQELKKYEYHFLQCFRQILHYALLKIEEKKSVSTRIAMPHYLDFNKDKASAFSVSMTIQKLIKQTFFYFSGRYALDSNQYEKYFSQTMMYSFFSFKRRLFYFIDASSTMLISSQNIAYWQETFNRFLLILDQMQKNLDLNIESYCHKLFKSLNIPIYREDIELFSQYAGVLFNSKEPIYQSPKKKEKERTKKNNTEAFSLSQEISPMFSLSKEGIEILLNRINTKKNLDIRYMNSREEFLSLLKTLKDPKDSPLKKEYTIGIILNSNSSFQTNPIPLIVHKKENKEMEIYAFDSRGQNYFEDIISSGIIESNKLHASMSNIQNTLSGYHLYSIYFLVMALQDMQTNSFEPQDIITLTNSPTFHFPFRWSSVCQITQDIEQQFSQQPLNQQVVLMNSKGILKYVNSNIFIEKDRNQQSRLIPFFCEENETAEKIGMSASFEQEFFYRDILEKQASVFFIQNMIDALKNQKQTLENLNEDSTIHLTSSA